MEKPLKIYLKILSPVHIGCDDVYEPTGFIIDESRRKFIAFDPMIFIKSLSDDERNEFSDLCMQGEVASIPKLYDFMSRKNIKGREVDIAGGLIGNYQKVKALAKTSDERRIRLELNQFAISRTAYNPHTSLPYIPGSSIKGALRNAYLNGVASKQNISKCWDKYLHEKDKGNDHKIYIAIGNKNVARRFEQDLLVGSFATDPFGLIKVSDLLPIGTVTTKIVYAVNKKKVETKFQKRSGPPQLLEVIQPDAVFEGTINIHAPHPKAGIQCPINEESLLQSLKSFYGKVFDVEQKLMKEIDAEQKMYNITKETFKDSLGSRAFIIRIGRHSGAEAVTVENNRFIKIMQGKDKSARYSNSATTLWLASETGKTTSNAGLLPFGWAILSLKPLNGQPSVEKDIVMQAQPEVSSQKEEQKPIDKFIAVIKTLKSSDAGPIGSKIDEALRKLETNEEKRHFARAVQEHLGKSFNKSKAKVKLSVFLD